MNEKFLKNKKELLILSIIMIIALATSFLYIGYTSDLGSDATEFKQASVYLFSETQVPIEALMNRVLTSPFFVYFSIFVSYFTKDFSLASAIINLIFYIFLIPAFYFLVFEIYAHKSIALYSSVLVAFNFYIIDPGNFHLADMAGWFFLILSTWAALKYISSKNRKFYFWSVGLGTIGFFFKEYGGLGLINLSLLLLVSDFPKNQKIKDIFLSWLIFVLPVAAYHFYFYLEYGISYISKMKYVANMSLTPGYESKSFVLLIKILGWLFSFGWLIFVYGVYNEWKENNIERIKKLIVLFPVTLTFLVWPSITQRLAVILLFWLATIAGYGLYKSKWYFSYLFLIGYILFNINIKILIDKINLPF